MNYSSWTPGFYVQKKPLTRLWENGVVLVVDHYRNYPYVLVHLDKVDPEDLKKLLTDSWLQRASKTLVKEYQKKLMIMLPQA